ncbi:hypothetical protein ZOSMA_41G01100 [Zostera marina]|uniref:Uncharacterized protein n=1 Tax=Zostera marina TaxID=29655 RepID=A0A0K9P4W6_ZOSMR|nr:hypothetical protein ZOSMA_41G01100 [Zostera marina]
MDRSRSINERPDTTTKIPVSSCDVEALKRCLEENKGDQSKCQAHVEAFKSACSLKKPASSSTPTHTNIT